MGTAACRTCLVKFAALDGDCRWPPERAYRVKFGTLNRLRLLGYDHLPIASADV